MKRLLVISIIMLCALPLSAQKYTEYLSSAKKHLQSGNIEKAISCYNVYKTMTGEVNDDFEKKLNTEIANNREGIHKTDGKESEYIRQTFTVKDVSFTMIPVAGGTFQMGATAEQNNPNSDENPVHRVTLSSYYIGETEVTQALWNAVMGSNPSNFKGNNLPVERVSWNDCQTFIRKLNEVTGQNFRLPTEAEWEYAARGGANREYQYSGSKDNNLGEVAWYGGNSGSKTHPVGMKQANELGLYDMSGNVWEWCSDWYGNYSTGSQTNPQGPTSGSNRVFRGGGWSYYAGYCRVASRSWDAPGRRYDFLGLRLVLQ